MKSADREAQLTKESDEALAELLTLLPMTVADLNKINYLSNRLVLLGLILSEERWLIDDEDEILAVVTPLLADNPKQLAQYREGNEKLWGYFFGRTMKALANRADPDVVTIVLTRALAE